MTAPNTVRSGVGFRYCQLFELDENGYPAATGVTAYTGISLPRVKRLTINDPEPKKINHHGDDRVFAVDALPPDESLDGEMVVAAINDDVDAALTGQKSFTVGEAKMFGIQTDKRGFERQMGILAFRQALDTKPGAQQLRRWEFRIFPAVLIIPREGSMDENPEERSYSLRPQIVTKHLWGAAFTEATEGFTEAAALRGIAVYKPRIVAFKGDAATLVFNFPATAQAVNVSKIIVWKNGTEVTSGVTKATTGLTFVAAPLATDTLVVFYEVA